MLGAGLYVLTGAVAKTTSGPAVILSYMAAAVAAFLSALCYAEFGARIPTTGIVDAVSWVMVYDWPNGADLRHVTNCTRAAPLIKHGG